MLNLIIKKPKSKFIYFFILFFLIFIFLWFKDSRSLDNDLGWRITTGEAILKNGVPRVDPFSYTMPGYPWVEHSWLTDVFVFLIYKVSGFSGLAFLSSIFIVGYLALSLSLIGVDDRFEKNFPKNNITFIVLVLPILILCITGLFRFSGIRSQVVTWFFTAVLLRTFLNESLWKKFKWWTPVLFLIWANFHGGFAAGLAVLCLVIFFKSYQKELSLSDLLVVLLSFALTLINPYGIDIYKEIWNTLTNSTSRMYITEWKSFFDFFEWSSLVFLVLSLSLVFRYRRKFSKEIKLIYLSFLLAFFLSVRQYPLWLITAMPLTILAVFFFYKEIKKSKESLRRFMGVYKFLICFCFVLVFLEGTIAINDALKPLNKSYPVQGISYIQSNLPEGNLFAEYDWGGYLIWKLPQKKVFIDGRMTHWKDENNFAASNQYFGIFEGSVDYKAVFEKYQVKTVLLKVDRKKYDNLKTSDNFFDRVFAGLYAKRRGKFNIVQSLRDDGWKEIYEDGTSVVFTKEDQNPT